MSHHVSASSANPTGAVEVVHVHSSAATTSPVDGGSGQGGLAKPAFTDVAGQSGTPGANLPVDSIEQASNTIQRGKADLAQTAGAERRLDGFDGVGGGGGGGAAKAAGANAAGGGNANANNATGAVAQGTANQNVSDQNNGLAAQRANGAQAVSSTVPQQDPRSTTPA
jgi:hypothetical protein